ncbi:atp synthase d chain protein [Rutstroemia sp. NJR-2017a BBW]|nr:atp synthase d chain protein [Rutstroemia sp. NJR-2017a BBW]
MPSQNPSSVPPSLILTTPPPLHPSWLAHIPSLPSPTPTTDPLLRKRIYRENCLRQNTHLLSTSLSHLTHNIHLTDSSIASSPTNTPPHSIPTRLYQPASLPSTVPTTHPLIIYLHGGGLQVGDLDTEDPTCRLLCLSLQLPVLSLTYRQLPQYTADDAVTDALDAYDHICSIYPGRPFILVGSSSGGQLASTIAFLRPSPLILGVALRCPVTCVATSETGVPEEWKTMHTSMREEFYTSILGGAATTEENRVKRHKMPLEMLGEMRQLEKGSEGTKWFVQVCTSDIYYSDGMCLGVGLRERGAQVKIRVEVGWPHTFWLKGLGLEEAGRAEEKLVEGVRWILAREKEGQGDNGKSEESWVEWSADMEE